MDLYREVLDWIKLGSSRWAAALVVLLLVWATSARAFAAPGAARPPGILVTARSVRDLPEDSARRSRPVHLRAVVTFYDPNMVPNEGLLFVHDATGSVYVSVPARPILPIRQGTLVEVSGVSGPGEFAPIVLGSQVRALGQSHVPRTAPLASYSQLMTGSYDGQWVELEGVVHSAFPSGQDVVLKLATSDGVVLAIMPRQDGADYSRLIDARLRVYAVAGTHFNKHRQLTGVCLYLQTLEDVTVLHPAPADPFAFPVRPIGRLLQFTPGISVFQRVHVQGRVTLHLAGRYLCVQDSTGGLCLSTGQNLTLREGDLVNVVGFPALEQSGPTLSDATVRKSEGGAIVPPLRITGPQATQSDHSGELVQIEAKLISFAPEYKDATLILEADGFLFPAILPRGVSAADKFTWKEGSTLLLTGIYSGEGEASRIGAQPGQRAQEFSLLLRSQKDVVLLEAPSWWNSRHTAMVLMMVLAATVAVLGWVAVLRRKVEQQTLLIRQSEERYRHLAQHDTLTGLPNRALLHDRLNVALERARRSGIPLALLMLDLDRFKQINDTFGHHAGDRVLCAAAERISAAVRKADTVARMGGDEFVVLLSDLAQPAAAQEVAAKIIAALAAPLEVEGHPILIFASIGICNYPGGGATAGALLQNVDAAMYRAKTLGRNCFQEFTPDPAPLHPRPAPPLMQLGKMELSM